MFLADDLMTMNQLAALLIAISAFVIFICLFGFITFVRWGKRETVKNRDRDIELATMERDGDDAPLG